MKCRNLERLFQRAYFCYSSSRSAGHCKNDPHLSNKQRHIDKFALISRYFTVGCKTPLSSGAALFEQQENSELKESCSANCACVCNTALWHVKNMQNLQSKDRNADLVCIIDDENLERIQIVMKIYGSERTVMRLRNESLNKSLERIRINIKNANAKLLKKVRKKSKNEDGLQGDNHTDDTFPQISLLDKDGKQIDEQLNVVQGWREGCVLRVCDAEYKVAVNPPKVDKIQIIQRPMVGFTIYPQTQFTFADPQYSKFNWFRRQYPEDNDSPESKQMEVDSAVTNKRVMESSDAESSICEEEMFESWESVGEFQTYTPAASDVGYEIGLKVTPGNENFPVEKDTCFSNSCEAFSVSTNNPVKNVEEKFLFEERVKMTKQKCTNDRFRVVSYNILAEVYAGTAYAQDFLFSYCPSEFMDINYRQQLVVKEISSYNSDIVCLQEVDRYLFESYYMPVMSVQGFAGAHASKEGIKEGVALFYRKERFSLKMVDNIILRTALKEDRNQDLRDKVALLESADKSKRILVGNTHLYWHPRGCHIRLIQMELILREMRRLYAEHSKESELSCLLTGDLNSHPHSAVLQLITKGHVPANHSDWFSMGKTEHLRDMTLSNSALFTSACGYPYYTTLVSSFQGCLDYIFIDNSLEVKKVVPQPEHDDVVKHCALPNVSTPSDHMAQVVEIAWKAD